MAIRGPPNNARKKQNRGAFLCSPAQDYAGVAKQQTLWPWEPVPARIAGANPAAPTLH